MIDEKKDLSKGIVCLEKKEGREEWNGEGLYRFLHCLILSLIESLVHFGSLWFTLTHKLKPHGINTVASGQMLAGKVICDQKLRCAPSISH